MEQRLTEIAHRMDLGPNFVTDRILRGLEDLPRDRLMKMLDDYESNLQQNREGIRNPAAYLMGMASRVRKQIANPPSPIVLAEVDSLFRSGHLDRREVDDRCLDILKQLPEDKAMQALSELRAVDISTVNNMGGFFMSILKKHSMSSRGGPTGGKGGSGSFGGGGGGGRGWENDYGRYQDSPASRSLSRGDTGHYPVHDRRDHHSHPHHMTQHDHHYGRHQSSEHDFGISEVQKDLPAPMVMPAELLYGYGDDEYVPEIPRPLEGSNLTIAVQDELELLIKRGILDVDDLDNRLMKELRSFPPHVALRVVKDFANLDKSKNVRSVSGFLMGIVKKHAGNSSGPGLTGPSGSYYHSGGERENERKGGDFYSSTHHPHQERALSRHSEYPYSGERGSNDQYYSHRERERGSAPYLDNYSASSGPQQTHAPGGMHFVDMVINDLVNQGLLRHEDVDERVREYLAVQQSWIIKKALTDFSNKDMSRINNKGNFLKGIVRKILEVENSGGRNVPPDQHDSQHYPSPRHNQPSQSGYYPSHQHSHPHRDSSVQGYSDPYYHGGKGGGGRGGGGMGGRYY